MIEPFVVGCLFGVLCGFGQVGGASVEDGSGDFFEEGFNGVGYVADVGDERLFGFQHIELGEVDGSSRIFGAVFEMGKKG